MVTGRKRKLTAVQEHFIWLKGRVVRRLKARELAARYGVSIRTIYQIQTHGEGRFLRAKTARNRPMEARA